jgi:hypothetical protein
MEERTEDYGKGEKNGENSFLETWRRHPDREGNGGTVGTHLGSQGTIISSTPSGDVDIHEGQDQETVPGSETPFLGQ